MNSSGVFISLKILISAAALYLSQNRPLNFCIVQSNQQPCITFGLAYIIENSEQANVNGALKLLNSAVWNNDLTKC